MKRSYRYWEQEDIDKLRLLYPNYPNLDELANKFGVSKRAMVRQCSKNNIKRNEELWKYVLSSKKDFNRKYRLDEFINNDNNFEWYWYGFILADGHINDKELIISLSIKDIEHLTILSNYLKCNINILKNNLYCGFRINDIVNVLKLKNKLHLLNFNKTENPPDISKYNISTEKMLSLIIGYIDGDGCIEISKEGRCKTIKMEVHGSWFNNLKFISEFLKNNFNIDSKVIINNRGYAHFSTNKHNQIKELFQKIKELNIPYLKRKWDMINCITKFKCNFFEEKKDEIIKLYKQGNNIHQISKILNVNYNSLINHKQKIYEI